MSKKPKNKEKVNNKKISSTGKINPNSYMSKYPSWKFSKCDKSHKQWGVNSDKIDSEVFEKLISYENITWAEIFKQTNGKGHSKNHFIETGYLDNKAKSRLKELGKIEDTVFSLAPTGKLRIFGILNDGVFEVLWIDKEHEICKSHKKNT